MERRPLPATLPSFAREPYRVFFPLATVAGILGAALWPLHFGGWLADYPGLAHARIMAHALFGGFIFGFLGTAMPRMLSAPPLRPPETLTLVAAHVAMLASYMAGSVFAGDLLFMLLLAGFVIMMLLRARHRQDIPPPGFVMVGLALAAVATGGVIALMESRVELDYFWITLQRLLSYQAFILLPILGVGPFILPRFFGLESAHNFPETLAPPREWKRKALLAGGAGFVILTTFVLEAAGWYRTAYGIRFATVLSYTLKELPVRRGPSGATVLGAAIRGAFVSIAAGFLAVALFPAYRIALLHLTLVGGFALITFIVATRVVYGHSGNLQLLQRPNRWLIPVFVLMLVGMATRISGDFWPRIMASHYVYGALLWIAGVIIWAVRVLPKVRLADEED